MVRLHRRTHDERRTEDEASESPFSHAHTICWLMHIVNAGAEAPAHESGVRMRVLTGNVKRVLPVKATGSTCRPAPI